MCGANNFGERAGVETTSKIMQLENNRHGYAIERQDKIMQLKDKRQKTKLCN